MPQSHYKPPRRRLRTSQIVCLVLLWIFLVYWLLVSVPRVDAMLLITIVMSGCLVGIPIYREIKARMHE